LKLKAYSLVVGNFHATSVANIFQLTVAHSLLDLPNIKSILIEWNYVRNLYKIKTIYNRNIDGYL